VFENFVNEDDWVMGSWRTHYKCLLKGVTQEEMDKAITEGKSISLCFPKYKVISSAIVGGILPIAVGTAMAIKMKGEKNKVVCFIGEMTSETGAAHEAIKYSLNHDLPILFVLEDNGKSVCTETLPTWGMEKLTYAPADILCPQMFNPKGIYHINKKLIYYKYESKFPHAGTGARINF
jgi:pyruvate dehydrogenase E1 component alpha subunit